MLFRSVDMVCMEYVRGGDAFTNFQLLLKSKAKKQAFADEVVSAALEIHSHKNNKFGHIENPVYDTWLDFYKPYADKIICGVRKLNKEGKFKSYILNAIEKAYSKFNYIFSEPVNEAVLTHGDLNVMNIMVDKKSLKPLAFIDPLESMYADREYDLFQFNNLTGKCFFLYKTYKEKFPVSRNCDLKCAFYALFHEAAMFIRNGKIHGFIVNPLVKNMNRLIDNIKTEI